ncbi:glycosyltransferase family 2 protein [Actinorugispora endophytica]|uniref:Glycosyl transferase family 2 n=1 Tax=Actinorugispora endophytica TaxID=1605990 RepID=A0A4R6V8E8_9ACTN|nr:glycosyltransferase family 2 protein [Actinorugispora endophytica]TDQ55552.1 glycosyl transferase family 2 [Actinorugispora endophytica]
MSTLSVIVPVRNVEPFITDTLMSLRRNARTDFEFIVVDDGSTDATPDLVSDAGLPGLSLIRNDAPTGPSAARNRGLAAAGGRYVTFLDGDDWLAPGYLPAAVEAITGLGVDFVKTDHVKATGKARAMARAPEGRRGVALPARSGILPENATTMVDYPNVWSGIYDRSLIDRGLLSFDEDLHTAEDRLWTWRLHLHADTYAVVPLVGVFYRREVSQSLTQIGDERQLQFFDAHDRVRDELAALDDGDLYLPKLVRTYCALIAFHLSRAERLDPRLRKELRSRAAQRLADMPRNLVARVLPALGPEREQYLAELVDLEAVA